MGLKLLLTFGLAFGLYGIDMQKVSSTVSKELQNAPQADDAFEENSFRSVGDQNSFFNAIASEIWKEASQSNATVNPQNLKNLSTPKANDVLTLTSASTINDQTKAFVDAKLADYLVWTIAIQSVVLLAFAMLYLDLQRRIAQVRVDSKIHNNHVALESEMKGKTQKINNLRKALL